MNATICDLCCKSYIKGQTTDAERFAAHFGRLSDFCMEHCYACGTAPNFAEIELMKSEDDYTTEDIAKALTAALFAQQS